MGVYGARRLLIQGVNTGKIIKIKQRLPPLLKSDLRLFKFVTTVSQYRKTYKKDDYLKESLYKITITNVQEFEDSPVKNISLFVSVLIMCIVDVCYSSLVISYHKS